MRSVHRLFHLAIPCADLDTTEQFYTKVLGCRRARRYDDRITLDFFGDQVVCHLAPEAIDATPELYPRHFGITFLNREEFDAMVQRVADKADGGGENSVKGEASAAVRILMPLTTRFAGRREEHLTIALLDPSNNVLEFKYYHDPAMVY